MTSAHGTRAVVLSDSAFRRTRVAPVPGSSVRVAGIWIREARAHVANKGIVLLLMANTYLKKRAPSDSEIVQLANRACKLNERSSEVLR